MQGSWLYWLFILQNYNLHCTYSKCIVAVPRRILGQFSWLAVHSLSEAAEASSAPVRIGVAKPLGASSVLPEYQSKSWRNTGNDRHTHVSAIATPSPKNETLLMVWQHFVSMEPLPRMSDVVINSTQTCHAHNLSKARVIIIKFCSCILSHCKNVWTTQLPVCVLTYTCTSTVHVGKYWKMDVYLINYFIVNVIRIRKVLISCIKLDHTYTFNYIKYGMLSCFCRCWSFIIC